MLHIYLARLRVLLGLVSRVDDLPQSIEVLLKPLGLSACFGRVEKVAQVLTKDHERFAPRCTPLAFEGVVRPGLLRRLVGSHELLEDTNGTAVRALRPNGRLVHEWECTATAPALPNASLLYGCMCRRWNFIGQGGLWLRGSVHRTDPGFHHALGSSPKQAKGHQGHDRGAG